MAHYVKMGLLFARRQDSRLTSSAMRSYPVNLRPQAQHLRRLHILFRVQSRESIICISAAPHAEHLSFDRVSLFFLINYPAIKMPKWVTLESSQFGLYPKDANSMPPNSHSLPILAILLAPLSVCPWLTSIRPL